MVNCDECGKEGKDCAFLPSKDPDQNQWCCICWAKFTYHSIRTYLLYNPKYDDMCDACKKRAKDKYENKPIAYLIMKLTKPTVGPLDTFIGNQEYNMCCYCNKPFSIAVDEWGLPLKIQPLYCLECYFKNGIDFVIPLEYESRFLASGCPAEGKCCFEQI